MNIKFKKWFIVPYKTHLIIANNCLYFNIIDSRNHHKWVFVIRVTALLLLVCVCHNNRKCSLPLIKIPLPSADTLRWCLPAIRPPQTRGPSGWRAPRGHYCCWTVASINLVWAAVVGNKDLKTTEINLWLYYLRNSLAKIHSGFRNVQGTNRTTKNMRRRRRKKPFVHILALRKYKNVYLAS